MPLEAHLALLILPLTWSLAVMSTVAMALLASNASQRADARKVLTLLFRLRYGKKHDD